MVFTLFDYNLYVLLDLFLINYILIFLLHIAQLFLIKGVIKPFFQLHFPFLQKEVQMRRGKELKLLKTKGRPCN